MKYQQASLFRDTVLAVCFALCCGAAAAQPPADRCELADAKKAFASAVVHLHGEKWSAAIPDLKKAANLCPVPPHPFSVSLTPFHFYQFLPFYYLGDSQYKSGDFPNALRSFYLSSERSEPKRDEEDATEKLASHTVACEKWFQRAGVGERNQYFSEAHRLRKLRTSEDWQEAAERFWDALQIEPENGQTTNAAGRWPDPYLPRFWLAKTLARLECYQLACDQLDRSLLNRLSSERIKEERNQMAELQLVCAKSRNEPVRSEICQRWQCWLKRGGLQTP